MENKSHEELEKDLKETSSQRKKVELDLEKYQEQIKVLQESISFSFDSLKSLRNRENNLQEELYALQKETIKDALNIMGFKKMFSDSTPFLTSLKGKAVETVQKVKGYVDGTYFDQKWIEETYSSYKEHCISKGEEIKSKEEFQKIALALKNMQSEEDNDLNMKDMVLKVSKEVGSATNSVKAVIQSMTFIEKLKIALNGNKEIDSEFFEEEIEYKDKKIVFQEWIENRDIQKPNTKSKDEMNKLYEDYVYYIEFLYPENSELIYSSKGGAFTAALNRNFESVVEENEPKKSSVKLKK